MTTPAPTVYIPTLNGGESLRRCLESLERQTLGTHVVVADNGEGEGSAALLSEHFPAVTRVGFGRNLGFGNALNRAIRRGRRRTDRPAQRRCRRRAAS